MHLRKLEAKDVPLMLEWMHDPSVVEFLQADFASKTITDCQAFIEEAQNLKDHIHLAITSDNDVYMGTVSLKNIHDGAAEFAICMRACAMGKGYSTDAMREIIDFGKILGIDTIFWCVSMNNIRAIHFYDKNGYRQVDYRSQFNKWGGTPRSKYRKCTGTAYRLAASFSCVTGGGLI